MSVFSFVLFVYIFGCLLFSYFFFLSFLFARSPVYYIFIIFSHVRITHAWVIIHIRLVANLFVLLVFFLTIMIRTEFVNIRSVGGGVDAVVGFVDVQPLVYVTARYFR